MTCRSVSHSTGYINNLTDAHVHTLETCPVTLSWRPAANNSRIVPVNMQAWIKMPRQLLQQGQVTRPGCATGRSVAP